MMQMTSFIFFFSVSVFQFQSQFAAKICRGYLLLAYWEVSIAQEGRLLFGGRSTGCLGAQAQLF
jgi:hypothetical protein